MRWHDIKKKGNSVYKTGKVEPIDLFKEGGILWDWCIGEIIAKAYRNRHGLLSMDQLIDVPKDLDEIIHYAEMLKAVIDEAERKESTNKV